MSATEDEQLPFDEDAPTVPGIVTDPESDAVSIDDDPTQPGVPPPDLPLEDQA